MTAIASFSVDAAGNVARAFHAAPAPVARFSTYAAAVPGIGADEADDVPLEPRVEAQRAHPGPCGAGEPEDVVDRPAGAPPALVERLDPEPDVARRQPHVDPERPAAVPYRAHDAAVQADDDPGRPRCGAPFHQPVGDLVRRGPLDDRGTRWRW